MSQKSKTGSGLHEEPQLPEITAGGPVQVLYADRILNVGFGPVVSRLTLGLENGPNAFTPFVTLVIPTIALMDAVETLQKNVIGNQDMNAMIIKGIDQVKDKLEQSKKSA